MTTPGPVDYLAKPTAMGRLISRLFEDRLFEHGVPHARSLLMATYADGQAAADLALLEPRPADQALRVALDVMVRAWDEAMAVHGMFRKSIELCLREIGLEIEELVSEHTALVRERSHAASPVGNVQMDAAQEAADADERRYALMRASGADPIPESNVPG